MKKEEKKPEVIETPPVESPIVDSTIMEPLGKLDENPLSESKDSASKEEEKKESTSKEAERIAKIDILFENYPLTRERLNGNDGFSVDTGTERFMASVDGFMRGSGKKPEDIDEALAMLYSIGFGVMRGDLSLDMLDVIVKGASHDRILAESTREAELRGRNANIEAKLREETAGDGVPHPGTYSGASPRAKNRGIFSLAESARR